MRIYKPIKVSLKLSNSEFEKKTTFILTTKKKTATIYNK